MNDYREIADSVGTPYYVYDADVIRERMKRLDDALMNVPHLICYAVKANDSLALIALAAGSGLGADIVSGGELTKALRAGVPADRIVFSGVGKTQPEIVAAADAGIRSLNVESLGELDVIEAEGRSREQSIPVSVRLNPDVEADTHAYISTGSAGSKFGLTFADALDVLRRAHASRSLRPVGVSFHIGSQIFDVNALRSASERAEELWLAAREEGIQLRDFDCGGGLGVPYNGGREPDLEGYAETLTETATRLDATLVLEPGRWLVAAAGTFVTRVLYTKDAPGRTIAVCDGGMNDLIRPALYDAFHPIETIADGSRPDGLVDVVGPVCESGDFFALGRQLPQPEPGDLLAIGFAGAYGRVMASNYNARPLPAEVLVENGAWRVIRERGTVEDLMRDEVFAPIPERAQRAMEENQSTTHPLEAT